MGNVRFGRKERERTLTFEEEEKEQIEIEVKKPKAIERKERKVRTQNLRTRRQKGGPRDPRRKRSPSTEEELSLSGSSSSSGSDNTSDASTDTNRTTTQTESLCREIRRETEGRERFAKFRKKDYLYTSRLFNLAGYHTVECIRPMQEQARQYYLADLRRGRGHRKPLKELRLTLEIFALFPIQKDEEKPRYEEVTIPVKLRRWAPSLQDLKGLLLPDQDECNHFSFELAKGRCKKPPMIPFITGELHKQPWMPPQEAHSRALDSWKNLQKTHKRPSTLELGFQSWIAYNLRFIMAGDLCGAWDTFGGLAAQLTHLGTVMNLAITENATIAQTYDKKVRTYAHELSKFRQREKDIIDLLKNEDQRIKRDTLRDCGTTQTFVKKDQNQKGGKDKPPRKDRKRGDKGKKGDKGGKGGKRPRWWDNDNSWKKNGSWKGNDWNNKEEEKADAEEPPTKDKTSEKAKKKK